jgi:hypothetical protein
LDVQRSLGFKGVSPIFGGQAFKDVDTFSALNGDGVHLFDESHVVANG